MKNIIIMGAPGSGKGTQSQKILKVTNYVHLATGDIIRRNIRNKTPLGKQCLTYSKKGQLVPDEIVINMVEQHIKTLNAKGIIWDGFPRTLNQAKVLDEMLSHLDETISKVFWLKISDKKLLSRVAGRLTCNNCGSTFHVIDMPPKINNICDNCGGRLVSRTDDKPQKFKVRLSNYYEWADKLKVYYQKKHLLVEIDGNQPLSKITESILEDLNG